MFPPKVVMPVKAKLNVHKAGVLLACKMLI
jgi:hypothetical protein